MREAMPIVSMDPRTFEGAVGPSDFDGKIVRARLIPFEYPNSTYGVQLAVYVRFQVFPDQGIDKEFFDEIYTAGKLENFKPGVPGEDSEGNPCSFFVEGDLERSWSEMDEEEKLTVEGTLPVPVGYSRTLAPSCKWSEFSTSVISSGFPEDKISAQVTFIEGAVGHFLRIPQMERKFKDRKEDTEKKFILSMVEFNSYEPGESTGGAPQVVKLDVEDKFVAVLSAELLKGPVKLGEIPALMVGALEGNDRGAAVKLVTPQFLARTDHPWTFDPERKKVTAV